jgi:hypothetical protein
MHSRLSRAAAGAATLLVALSMTTGAALAKGGGGGGGGGGTGGGTPAPAPAPAPDPAPQPDCFGDPAIVAMTTPDIAVNYAGGAGCVGVRTSATSLSLAWVVLTPGWTYEVLSNGGGTNSRVQLKFTETATGLTRDFRFEFGKTVVR